MAIAESNETIRREESRPSNAEALLAPIRALRRRLVLRAIASALTSILLIALFSALVAMTLDAFWHWRTLAPRWVSSIAVLGATLLGVVVIVVRRSWSFSLIGLAKRLEEIFPSSGQELCGAVSIALADANDPLAGSNRLRARLMRRAMILLTEIDLNRAVATSALRLRMVLLICYALLITIWSTAAPQMIWQAARRLAAPWRLDAWPRQVVLELDAPEKIARGSDAVLFVRSKTSFIPASATIYFAGDDGTTWSQPMRLEEKRFTISIPKLKESAWLRVTGGDDDQMRWQRLEVVEPISLSVTKLLAVPPEYTKLPPVKVSGEMVVLEGTKLQVEFRASRPIRQAAPKIGGRDTPLLPALKIDMRGKRASGEWTLDASLTTSVAKLRVDVRDTEGTLVSGAWNGTLKILRDTPPVIEWREPKGLVKVQPQSRLSLAARVTDDVRLTSIELRRRVLRAMGEPTDSKAAWQVYSTISMTEELKEYGFEEACELAEFQFQLGDTLEWLLVAIDAKGQAKESEIVRCSVVGVAEIRKEIDGRLERFLAQLTDAARKQREVANSLQDALKLTTEDLPSSDRLKSKMMATARAAQFDEQAIAELLSNPASGLIELWRRLVEEQTAQRLLSDEDTALLNGVSNELESISQQDVPAVLRELDRLQESSASGEAELRFDTAAKDAEIASDHFDAVVNRLAHWRRWVQAAQTIGELLDAQQKLLEETRGAAPGLLGRLLDELSDEERRKLDRLAARQSKLSQQLAGLPPPPESHGDRWRDAKSLADDEMRQAVRDLTLNQLSQADSHQDLALNAMRELSKVGATGGSDGAQLENSQKEADGATERKRTGPTEAQLKDVIVKQSELRERTKVALESLSKPGANKSAVETELARLAVAQAELAKQVEAWQSAAAIEESNKEPPRE